MANASGLVLRGKVVMEDGSIPDRPVSIERHCGDNTHEHIAATNARGEYIWHANVNSSSAALLVSDTLMTAGGVMSNAVPNGSCVLRAALRGYESNFIQVDDLNSFSNPILPVLVLSRRGSQPNFDMLSGSSVPRGVSNSWSRAAKAVHAQNWPEAERNLRAAVQAAPRFAPGWNALGNVLLYEQKESEARQAYQRAIEADPRTLAPYLLLSRLSVAAQDWDAAAQSSAALIKADTKKQFPEGYLYQAIARYHRKDLEGAEASAMEAVRLDKNHDVPRTEYVYGLILAARHDFGPAREHMSRYLQLDPRASDAEAVRSRLQGLGKPEATPVSGAPVSERDEVGQELQGIAANLQLGRAEEAWVPGGLKALAAAAHLSDMPAPQDFFAEYCRAITREFSVGSGRGIPQYLESLRAFMASVSALSLLGEHRDDRTVVTLSLKGEPRRNLTARMLSLLGWKIVQAGASVSVEPGDQAGDGVKQQILTWFGVDPVDMQESLDAGKTFQFDIPSENARLSGGEAWTELLREKNLPGGIAAAFATDVRLAAVYAGLSSMSPEATTALISGVPLRTLVTRYAGVFARYAEAFAVSADGVALPGGPAAEPAWKKLTGASPRDPASFFRALLDKDQGRLAAFYFALWRADPAHQHFFTRTPQIAGNFYVWYRDSDELRDGIARQAAGWNTGLLQKLPLDGAGNPRFPGGQRAWMDSSTSDLLSMDALEALVPVARIEEERKTPLDEDSARLLARHYPEWRALFSYFEKLALGREEFGALAAFTASVSKLPPASQNLVLGQWYPLVELMVRGVAAGSLDSAQAARYFGIACARLALPDPSTATVQILREISGGAADLDEAVPAGLLRLSGGRRAAYDRVIQLQNIPRLASLAKDPGQIVAALSGLVYAASLDPDGLLVNEDPKLVRKHRFTASPLFSEAALVRSANAGGSFLTGGFMKFSVVADSLAGGGDTSPKPSEPSPTVAALSPVRLAETEIDPAAAVFRASAQLVEVYATVTDGAGHYADDLARDRFTISDQGSTAEVIGFEPRSAEVSVALLLDTTGSMHGALPALKNAALKLTGELRPSDAVAVYSFNDTLTELQPFTTDRQAAKRAVLTTQALGDTALYDALTRVGRDLSGRAGKKVIVVFTDGNDNSSTLSTDSAILRAKAAGVPVYTIAQGEALLNPEFLKQLASVSKATGGVSFVIHESTEIRGVFEKVSEDLTHGYLLMFQPAPIEDHAWRKIDVEVRGSKKYKVRAREGYYPRVPTENP
jgi:Ca-activated chloride channel family protein